jgi:hypothetical protein
MKGARDADKQRQRRAKTKYGCIPPAHEQNCDCADSNRHTTPGVGHSLRQFNEVAQTLEENSLRQIGMFRLENDKPLH